MKQQSRLCTRGNYASPNLEKHQVSILVICILKLVSFLSRYSIHSNPIRDKERMYALFIYQRTLVGKPEVKN